MQSLLQDLALVFTHSHINIRIWLYCMLPSFRIICYAKLTYVCFLSPLIFLCLPLCFMLPLGQVVFVT